MSGPGREEIKALALQEGFIRARIYRPLSGGAFLAVALPVDNSRARPPSEGLCFETPRGACEIAEFALGNYYKSAVEKLKSVRRALGCKKAMFRVYCNSRLDEKNMAVSCGLGSIGRNSLIITPEAGSSVVIAFAALPFELEGEGPCGENPCFKCPAENPPCAAACPCKALKKEGGIELEKCIQWYASGRGNSVPDYVAKRWGRRLYGCVECQRFCPCNGPVSVRGAAARLERFVNINEFLRLSDEEIRAKFNGSALGFKWLGPQTLRRSALLAKQFNEADTI